MFGQVDRGLELGGVQAPIGEDDAAMSSGMHVVAGHPRSSHRHRRPSCPTSRRCVVADSVGGERRRRAAEGLDDQREDDEPHNPSRGVDASSIPPSVRRAVESPARGDRARPKPGCDIPEDREDAACGGCDDGRGALLGVKCYSSRRLHSRDRVTGPSALPDDEGIPDRLRRVRGRLGLSQERLAALLGVSFASVNRWERGATRPAPALLARLDLLEAPPPISWPRRRPRSSGRPGRWGSRSTGECRRRMGSHPPVPGRGPGRAHLRPSTAAGRGAAPAPATSLIGRGQTSSRSARSSASTGSSR